MTVGAYSKILPLILVPILVTCACTRGQSQKSEPRTAATSAPAEPSAPGVSSPGGAPAGQSGSTTPIGPDAGERERIAARLDAIAAMARRAVSTVAVDHEDPLAVLATTGKDPSAILAWVRANTRLVAYRGTLRGSRGVLMDRAGNSLDRALLLAELLAKAGHEGRLARAELNPEAAAKLRTRIETSQPAVAPRPPLDRAALLARAGDDPRIDHQLLENAVDDTIADRRRFDATVSDLYGLVLPAVQGSLEDNQRRNAQLVADAEAVLRDHFWVERRTATGWETLDPDGDVVQVPAPTANFSSAQVPAEFRHEVALRLILETWSAGKLNQTRLLERSWFPSETTDKPILLRHELLPVPPIEQIVRERDPRAAFRAALTGAWVVEPVLFIGGEEVRDRLFTLRGDTLPANINTLNQLGVGPLFNQGFTTLNKGLQGAFGGAPTAQPPATQPPAAPPDENTSSVRVIAEWLEIEVRVPGQPAERHQRTVFDLLGPAERARGPVATAPTIDTAAKERRALALASDIDVVAFGAIPTGEWLARIAGQKLADAADQAAALIRSGKSPFEVLGSPPANRVPLLLWAWAVNRNVSGMLAPAASVAPNVALLWSTPSWSGDARVSFDIVANQTSTAAGFDRRVAQGVLDTVLEYAVLTDGTPDGNTASLHALDLPAGRTWVRLDPGDRAAVDRLNLPPDAKARIQADLAAGLLVVAPKEPIHTASGEHVAWWRIDPRTGATLGIGADGRGSATERGLVHKYEADYTVCGFFALGEILGGHYGAAFVGGALCAGFGWAGAKHAHAMTTVVGESVIEIAIHLFTVVEPPGGHK